MARKKSTHDETEADETTSDLDPSAPSRDPKPLEVDGQTVPHPRHPHVAQIDPASLRGPDGGDPILALPAEGGKFVLRAVLAIHAAQLLACDDITGGPSRHRLATVAEAEAFIRGEV